MRSIRRTLTLLVVLALAIALVPAVSALDFRLPEDSGTAVIPFQVNPLYEDIYTAEDFQIPAFPDVPDRTNSTQAVTYQTVAQAGAKMRQYMKNRTESFTIYVTGSKDYQAIANQILEIAMAHTGDPEEGDYLMWQYGGCSAKVSYEKVESGVYNHTFNFVVAYYTTAQQEAEMDTAVSKVLKSLNVGSKSDYQKICAVYDYICDNVSYDYANLNDDSYVLKHTAYAALTDKTAVCQGYALLFYRLMLELDVDNRIVTGVTDSMENHGWNIVELDGLYYNVDATWDAGYTDYDWFLLNTWDFLGHYRFMDYETMEFHTAYPMAAESYASGVKAEMDPYIYIGACGDNAAFAMMRDGTLRIAGEGKTWDYNYYDSEKQAPWLFWKDNILELVVDEGITYIGDFAFTYLEALTAATLPDSLLEIGSDVFCFCRELDGVILPENLEIIGSSAFTQCSSLSKIQIPASVTSIDDHAFSGCDALKTVVIPANVTDLGYSIFQGCDGLVTAYMLGTQTGLATFEACSSLAEVYFTDNLEILDDELFRSCESLARIAVPANVKEIGFDCFYGCKNLKNIYFSGDAPEISNGAFGGFKATAWYPAGNETYTSELMQRFSYYLTWMPHNPLKITQQPESTSALDGQRATVTVQAEGDGLTYKWYYTAAGSDKFYLTTAFTGNRYYVDMNEDRDNRQVYCVITDSHGNSVITDTVTLNLLAITKELPNRRAPLGEMVKTTFTATGDGLTYTWYVKDPGQTSFVKSSAKTNTYSYRMTEAKSGRQVYCVITDRYGSTITTRTALLNAAASITRQPANASAMDGTVAKTSITAFGTKLSYQWYVCNPGSSTFVKSSCTGTTYSCRMSAAIDGRRVYCIVTDGYGNTAKSDTVTLTMSEAVKITGEPANRRAPLGGQVKTTVKATGDDLTYTWYVRDPGSAAFTKSSVKTATYSVKMTTAKSGREVYCVITDRYGNTATTRTAVLSAAASITAQPADASAANGAVVKTSVTAFGTKLSYQWYIANPGSSAFHASSCTGATYSCRMSAANDGRRVYCIVTDGYGNTAISDIATLTME